MECLEFFLKLSGITSTHVSKNSAITAGVKSCRIHQRVLLSTSQRLNMICKVSILFSVAFMGVTKIKMSHGGVLLWDAVSTFMANSYPCDFNPDCCMNKNLTMHDEAVLLLLLLCSG